MSARLRRLAGGLPDRRKVRVMTRDRAVGRLTPRSDREGRRLRLTPLLLLPPRHYHHRFRRCVT
jgi:hypothetical protein